MSNDQAQTAKAATATATKSMTITAKSTKAPEGKPSEHTFTLNILGNTLEEDIRIVGADVVKSRYEKSVVIAAQNIARSALEAGKDLAEIDATLASWKPGVATRVKGASVVDKFMAAFATMTPEEKAEHIKALKQQLKG